MTKKQSNSVLHAGPSEGVGVVHNFRDPAVLAHGDGIYTVFYTRLASVESCATRCEWNDSANWSVWSVRTADFATFDAPRRITPDGFASPSEVKRLAQSPKTGFRVCGSVGLRVKKVNPKYARRITYNPPDYWTED